MNRQGGRDSACGSTDDCPRPASVVHAETFQRLCDSCAFGLDVLNHRGAGGRAGCAGTAGAGDGEIRGVRRGAGPVGAGNRIAGELPGRVSDPVWRAELCAELAGNPGAVNGLLIGVGALSHRDVLDLYPALCALGAQLPVGIRADLSRARVRPLSPVGVAALRLGL